MSDAAKSWTLKAATTALIVQDLQNDVVSKGGGLEHTGSHEHARKQDVVNNVKHLAEVARLAGAAVIHVWHHVPDGAEQLNAPLFQTVKAHGVAKKGSWGASPALGLEPKEGDYIVEKLRMNAFYNTTLESILKGLGIKTLVIAGALTNMSVEHTARHGADAGFEIVVPSNGTSSLNDEWHHAGLHYALTQIGRVATCEEIEAAFMAKMSA
jgi:nicotinamidase-related amidase